MLISRYTTNMANTSIEYPKYIRVGGRTEMKHSPKFDDNAKAENFYWREAGAWGIKIKKDVDGNWKTDASDYSSDMQYLNGLDVEVNH